LVQRPGWGAGGWGDVAIRGGTSEEIRGQTEGNGETRGGNQKTFGGPPGHFHVFLWANWGLARRGCGGGAGGPPTSFTDRVDGGLFFRFIIV